MSGFISPRRTVIDLLIKCMMDFWLVFPRMGLGDNTILTYGQSQGEAYLSTKQSDTEHMGEKTHGSTEEGKNVHVVSAERCDCFW